MKIKNFFILLILFGFSFLLFGEEIIPQNSSAVFVKYESVWVVKNEGDLGKDFNSKEVKDKVLLNLGNKVTVIGNRKIADKVFLNVQLPDMEKYWAPLSYFTMKFIVITQDGIAIFKQPEQSYIDKNKLGAGMLCYYVKSTGDFINVDVSSYMMNKSNNTVVWLGNVWIKANSGYTEDINAGIQASYLSSAYNLLYGKKNSEGAIAKLKAALKAGEGLNSPVDSVISGLLQELEGSTKTVQLDPKATYYSPTIDNLRFRESATMDGKVIRILNKSEKLKLLENGAEATINDIKGAWKKFETEKGETGWCFDGYLVKIQ